MRNDYLVKRTYYSFVVVSILSSLTATAGMLIDNIIVGRSLGADALGAMGVVGPLSLILSAIGNICAAGGGARAAQALGRGERDRMNSIFTANTLLVLICGGLITVLGLLLTPQLALLLGAKDELLSPTIAYLYGYFPGAIPTMLLSATMSFIRIDGSPRLPLLCIAVMTTANILLDLLMIYVFSLGMFGMAVATTLSYCLAVATALLHFRKKEAHLRLVRPEGLLEELRQTVATGFPSAISRISDTVKVTLLNHLLVTLVSVSAVTALSVRTQAQNLLGAAVMGVSQALLPTMGMFFGEEDRTAMRDTLRTTLRFGLAAVTVLAAALVSVPSFFSGLLGVRTGETLAMSNMALRLFAVGLPFYLINHVLMNFYQCTRRAGLAALICVLQSLVYTAALALALVRPLGAGGVWLALLLGEVLTLATVLILICVRNRRVSLRLSDVMLLPEDFGGRDRVDVSIGNSMEEVMALSTGVYAFGRARHIDERTLHELSLCVEELAGNVIRHAFRPGEKRWLDLSLIDTPDAVILRLRDNGAPFDPLAQLASREKEQYGILLSHAVSDSFAYRRSLGLNNLILRLRKSAGHDA